MSKLIPITTPLREFKGHEDYVMAVAVFHDKRRMVTGSWDSTLRLWDQPIKAHSSAIYSLDFSPDGTVLATSSWDKTTKLWNTKTWQPQGNPSPVWCDYSEVNCIQYSPSGKVLAIATCNIQIYNPGKRKRIASFKAHTKSSFSLAWTPDGTRLLTGGDNDDPTIREWDALTWQQVGDPWTGHSGYIDAIVVNSAGTFVASASSDQDVRLWRLSDRETVAIFQHSSATLCVTFSVDGKHILSGGQDKMISEWAVPNDINSKILAITTARIACIDGDLSTAEELLTQDINTAPHKHTSYAHRSFVMARKHNWDHALRDAIDSIRIQPSLAGYISKGIALCGKRRIRDARAAFDVASMYTDQDPQTIHFLLLIKVIALFNADKHDEAKLLLKELTTGCPNSDALACRVVEAYLHVQLGIKALDGAHHEEAAHHFTVAINSGAFSSKFIHEIYEDLVILFGWDLKSLWLTAHQKHCRALLLAGKLQDAVKTYQCIMDTSDDITKASCLDWSNTFTEECGTLCLTSGDAAFDTSNYDRAIDFYSAAIDLNFASDTVFVKRSKARLGKMLWTEALLDAQKVTELNSSSYLGYNLKHAALHGEQRYDEAIQAFQIMLSKLVNAPDTVTRKLRQQYLSPSEVDSAIQKVIDTQLDNAPMRVLDTTTGLLCDREAQIHTFKTSMEYKELVSSTIAHPDFLKKRIEKVVITHFRYVMLSHRWEGQEPLLQDIEGKIVYELDPVGGIMKLQSFCKTAHDLGYRWAWSDTCCIDKRNDVELQESVNSMFVWYRHSALTVIYLSDVPPSSKAGALAQSAWNTRGWTVQEFLAPKIILFYQKDWTLYLDDRTSNHKESVVIMQELEYATSIDRRVVVAFRPGMRDAREKLQWASTRVTTLQEDIAYSLSGVFGVRLRVDYGEKKQNALGRLLQEIIARSGDITALDWVGKSSEFNSCLPADIASYEAPPCKLPSLSEDEIQSLVSSLRGVVSLQSASELYQTLDCLSAPRFAHRRLHLPCIAFPITEARRRPGRDQDTYIYELKSDGLHDLQITTTDRLIPFSPVRPPPNWQTILLVRPWSRDLLELHDPADDIQDMEDWTIPESPSHDSPAVQNKLVYSVSYSRALRLIVRLGQPFSALLLARQRDGEFKRIASDYDIIPRVKDMTSVDNIMDIRTPEIL